MTMTLFIQAALVVAGLSVAGFCHLLARRLRKLNDLETGLGGAIAVMAAEIARLEAALAAAQAGATHARTARARDREGEIRTRLLGAATAIHAAGRPVAQTAPPPRNGGGGCLAGCSGPVSPCWPSA